MKYGWQVPPYSETREYVRRISARYNSVTNPTSPANSIRRVSNDEAAILEEKAASPLTNFEPNTLAIRLPDGSMRLVNQ